MSKPTGVLSVWIGSTKGMFCSTELCDRNEEVFKSKSNSLRGDHKGGAHHTACLTASLKGTFIRVL